MILADYLLEPHIISSDLDKLTELQVEHIKQMDITDQSNSNALEKIPLVSSAPILATSDKYILVNELTKRRNQIIVFDQDWEKFATRSPTKIPFLKALWYENQREFLLLTEENVFKLNPKTMEIEIITDIIPKENKIFHNFIIINETTLLIAYNEWAVETVDRWQQNSENGSWTLINRQPLQLTQNEFIEDIINSEDDSKSFGITIYNRLTERWRIEIRGTDTLTCIRRISLPESSMDMNYRMLYINDPESDIKWLVFSPKNTKIIAIDANYNKKTLNYTHPVHRMEMLKQNYLIVRTRERIDIHKLI